MDRESASISFLQFIVLIIAMGITYLIMGFMVDYLTTEIIATAAMTQEVKDQAVFGLTTAKYVFPILTLIAIAVGTFSYAQRSPIPGDDEVRQWRGNVRNLPVERRQSDGFTPTTAWEARHQPTVEETARTTVVLTPKVSVKKPEPEPEKDNSIYSIDPDFLEVTEHGEDI